MWKHEPEPKYIYYVGQCKTLEEWNDKRKADQDAIYKAFEEQTTFTGVTLFKKSYYDKDSIWEYNDDGNDIEMRIKDLKNITNDVSDNVEYLIKNFDDKDDKGSIERIKNIVKELEEL